MARPWERAWQRAELADQAHEAQRVRSLEVAVAENRRRDALLERRVEELERAVVELLERAETTEEIPPEE